MKKIILISLLLHSIWGISQNNNSSQNYCDSIAKDSIMYFPVWEIINEKLFPIFDNIIEKNKKCLKKKKWESIIDNYFFQISIHNYPNREDTNNIYQISIRPYADFDLIKTFSIMAGCNNHALNFYSGLILYKNEVFMIANNPRVMNKIPFISKTNKVYGVNTKNKQIITNDFPYYYLKFNIIYNDGDFKTKKSCCP